MSFVTHTLTKKFCCRRVLILSSGCCTARLFFCDFRRVMARLFKILASSRISWTNCSSEVYTSGTIEISTDEGGTPLRIDRRSLTAKEGHLLNKRDVFLVPYDSKVETVVTINPVYFDCKAIVRLASELLTSVLTQVDVLSVDSKTCLKATTWLMENSTSFHSFVTIPARVHKISTYTGTTPFTFSLVSNWHIVPERWRI